MLTTLLNHMSLSFRQFVSYVFPCFDFESNNGRSAGFEAPAHQTSIAMTSIKSQAHYRNAIFKFKDKSVKVTELIGEGGYAYVFLVQNVAIPSEKYAVKKLLCQTDEQVTAAHREIEMSQKLQSFDYIMKVYDSTESPSLAAPEHTEVLILCDYYPNGTLYDWIQQWKQTQWKTEDEILDLFLACCQGIQALHSHSPALVHGDIKPGNVLLDAQYKPFWSDFGSVREARITIESRQQALEYQEWAEQHCTMSYRAPELFTISSKAKLDERSDVWSLGCLLFSLCYGMSPFEYIQQEKGGSISLSIINGKVEYPDKPVYSSGVRHLIDSMCHIVTRKRPKLSKIIKQIEKLRERTHSEVQVSLEDDTNTNYRSRRREIGDTNKEKKRD